MQIFLQCTETVLSTVVELTGDVERRIAVDADAESKLFDVVGGLVEVGMLEATEVEERRDVTLRHATSSHCRPQQPYAS